ncbi:G-protein coupled receptor 61-like [Rhinatrema bivittatum]|uniref:G-protein coupled receptor 61-like n=1 Tax=Rhinatrema bivittatum TaxID=194408 RepID=UPI0011292114|nr:G-protein coupled receptor 61-like [Rhinatrema bivittatum]
MEGLHTSKKLWNGSGNCSPVCLHSGPGAGSRAPAEPQTLRECLGLFLMLLVDLLAVVGNAAVTVVIVKTPQLRKFLFVVHLCIVDTLAALTVMPLGMVSGSAVFGRVEFGASFCQLYLALGVCFSCASSLTISAITIERYYYIVHPMRYEVKMTLGVAVSVLLFIWVQAILIAMVPLLSWTSAGNEPGNASFVNSTRCSLHNNVGDYSEVFVLFFTMLCFVLPLIIILSVYFSVFRVARIAALQHGPLPSWAATPRRRSDSMGSQATIVAASRPQKMSPERVFGGGKAAFTLILIGGQFLICWLPYFTYHLHTAIINKSIARDLWETTVTWLAYTSFTVNPLFYGCLNRQIREELIRLPKCFLKQSLDEQLGLSSHEGSVEENFLQFLQRTSCVADKRTSFSSASSPRILANPSTLTCRIPGQIPEETPELLEQECTERLRNVQNYVKHES